MPRLLLVAATTGYQTRSFAAAARSHGIDVLLATDRCHILEDPWRDNAIPVKFEEPEAASALLSEVLGDISVDGIVAVADRPTLVAALTAQKLDLPYHPPAAAAACRDKHLMRNIFGCAGLPVPEYFRVAVDSGPLVAAKAASYPCVLKPLGLSASRGVIRANNPTEFVVAFNRIRRILEQPEIRQLKEAQNNSIQIEQYIEGREFAVEGIMTDGELNVLAIFDKPDPLEGPYFEETIYVTPSRESESTQAIITKTVRQAVKALGLYHGPVHAEMRVNSGGVYMLEIAARPIGGLCARALRFAGGLTLEDVVVLHAVGRMPANLTLASPSLGVMMIPVPGAGLFEAVTGIEAARSRSGVDDVVITAKRGQKFVPLPEGAGYPGFIFASGSNPEAVETSLREAHSLLKFEILGTLSVIGDAIA